MGPKSNTAEILENIKERKRTNTEINKNRTRAETIRVHEEYLHVCKIAKESIKADKRNYMNMLVTERATAAHQADLRELYTTI